MRIVSQLATELTPYLARNDGNSAGTTLIGMLNITLPRLYEMGDWKALEVEYNVDGRSGYFCLPPDYECVLSARSFDYPIIIRSQGYEDRIGALDRPVDHMYGIIDRGMHSLMSEIASSGCDELIFTSTATFASGDTAKITYTDTVDGYTVVTLPLNTITVDTSIASGDAVTAGSGTQTKLTVTSTAGLVVGLGLTLAQVSGTDATYIGTFRIAAVNDATNVTIDKAFVSLTGTISAVSTPRLMPANAIASVESIVYTSLPGRTMVKDLDGIIYAILPAGDGVSSFRRYEVPQVPADTAEEWPISTVCKRAFFPITATNDIVYLDHMTALRYAFQAVCYEDSGDVERAHVFWGKAEKALNDQLFDTRGGVQKIPEVQLWGDGIPNIYAR